MEKAICQVSGEEFFVSELEKNLRKKFGFGDMLPSIKPKYRFRELGAFWPHWSLHQRKCNKTQKSIISIFRPDCVYPVWQRDEWIKHSNPPSSDFNFSPEFFPQAWELFQKCPLPHKTGTGNENCEYTEDWWYSKNCYLSHSGYECEDLKYCYRSIYTKDCAFCVFTFTSEVSIDLINSHNCFNTFYVLNGKNIRDSAFLYDCRNCSDCMFCFNLRNKKYCFGNKQLTKEEFLRKKSEWNLKSRKVYDKAQEFFREMMAKQAWHKHLDIEKCENVSGDFLLESKDMQNCYFISNGSEDCANAIRGGVNMKSGADMVNCWGSELVFCTSGSQDRCYEISHCVNVFESRSLNYSAYCFQCSDCFGCCGLVGKKYCIFNKQYTKEEYELLVPKIIAHMKQTGEWGKFFPGKFAPNPYDESWSSFHFPLSDEEKERNGFRSAPALERENQKTADISDIPDSVDDLDTEKTEWLTKQVFWDSEYKRPFRIQLSDIDFCKKLGVPLPNSYYMKRIQENFRWMPFQGELRETVCGKCQKEIKTSWEHGNDERILCEECYLGILS